MAETMALESPEEGFQTSENLTAEPTAESSDIVEAETAGRGKEVTSWMGTSGVSNFLAQPLVKRTIPALSLIHI